MKSLFGDEISDTPPERRRRTVDRAHARAVGSGPEGRTCGQCEHMERPDYHGVIYRKCGLMWLRWTHGEKTDIRCKDAACREFTEKQKGENDD